MSADKTLLEVAPSARTASTNARATEPSLRAAAAASRAVGSSGGVSSGRVFSFEIHGVRGLALTMVVAFHLFGQGRVSGGVDVFLVISAYLMTGSLLRAIDAGHLSLVHRYGRTFSRLLPAALLTIITTTLVGVPVLPRSRWIGLFEEARSAAIFQENVYLATTGLSYEAAGSATSPFQHFWSLSMQGQWLLLWPALALLIIALKGLRAHYQKALFAAITIGITIWSFTIAIQMVEVDQAVAYYSLNARLWEFGLGSLAAYTTTWAKRLPNIGAIAGWVGIIMILTSGLITNGATTFPGPWTLWPTIGALLVLFAADSGGAAKYGLTQMLSAKPIVWLANRGYPLYLWHWPILIYYLTYTQKQAVGFTEATLVLAFSLLLSEATNRYLSKPLVNQANKAQTTRRGSLLLLTGLIAAALTTAGTAQAAIQQEKQHAKALLEEAASVSSGEREQTPQSENFSGYDADKPLVPALDVAQKDTPSIYGEGCVQNWRDGDGFGEVLVCPDIPGPEAKEVANPKRVVMGGGSHVTQFYPAFRQIADEEGWELIVVDKDGCRFQTDGPDSTRRETCIEWNEAAPDVIASLDPDVFITLGTVGNPKSVDHVVPSMVEAWESLTTLGVPVVVMRDSPRFPQSVPECLETTADFIECAANPADVYAKPSPLEGLTLPTDVYPIDFTSAFCDDVSCPATFGNIVGYRDKSHVTATFARALANDIRAELEVALPELFTN